MKFVVMLAVLLFRQVPGVRLIQYLDRRYTRLLVLIERITGHRAGRVLPYVLGVLPPVLLLWEGLALVPETTWHLATLMIHLVVVFYVLGRRDEMTWIARYMIAWRQGDYEAARHYALELLDDDETGLTPVNMHCRLVARLLVHAFDRLFLVLFWYLLLGPVVALLARLSALAIEWAQTQGQTVNPWILRLQGLLEWPAARVLGLTLALVGRPVLGIRQWLMDLLRWRLSTEVYLNRQLITRFGAVSGTEDSTDKVTVYCQRPEHFSAEADHELSCVREMVWRALAVWVALSALSVIFFPALN